MNSMQESQQEMEKLLIYKTKETSDVKTMIADLDKKIDDLKLNLSLLKDNLKD